MTQPDSEDLAGAAPFTRAVDVSGLHEPQELKARASESECAALARLLNLDRIEMLSGRASVTPQGGGRFVLEGAFEAAVHPVCVVSSAPFRREISGRFTRHYAVTPAEEANPGGGEVELGADDSLYPDVIPDGMLDFAAALAEELALTLDPFPRAPGAVFQAPEQPDGGESPFAALAQLKKP